MGVTIRPMTRADIPVCADIGDNAFHDDGMYRMIYPRYQTFPHELRQKWLIKLKQRFVQPRVVCMVAEYAEEGSMATRVVGFGVWQRNGDDPGAQERLSKDSLNNSE